MFPHEIFTELVQFFPSWFNFCGAGFQIFAGLNLENLGNQLPQREANLNLKFSKIFKDTYELSPPATSVMASW